MGCEQNIIEKIGVEISVSLKLWLELLSALRENKFHTYAAFAHTKFLPSLIFCVNYSYCALTSVYLIFSLSTCSSGGKYFPSSHCSRKLVVTCFIFIRMNENIILHHNLQHEWNQTENVEKTESDERSPEQSEVQERAKKRKIVLKEMT